jgi:D-alanyl-D-alanine carboxypeptidase/D-alanyl-D-alanine-endopeptidase (penicillin-binding protein 4)
VFRFEKTINESHWNLVPPRFKNVLIEDLSIARGGYQFQREHQINQYRYAVQTNEPLLSFSTDKPFITSAPFVTELLSEAVEKPITLIPDKHYHLLPHLKLATAEADSIYAQMLKISDNFLAEQLLLLASDQLFDSLNIHSVIQYSKENYLQDLPDEPQWVDGSGLSAQNMFTPRSIITLLKKIKAEVPLEKIKAYFPAGGESGTIRNYYKSDPGEPPYVYAKTGTLSMSISLSGYLFTKIGKILMFSFLLNNYMLASNDLKKEMEKVLYVLHDRY